MSVEWPVDRARLREAARAYDEDGYAVLSGIFGSEEIEEWSLECERVAEALREADADDPRVQSRAHRDGRAVRDRCDPVSEFSTRFRELVSDPRLHEIADAILGAESVRFKDRLILKSKGTHGYGLHADWPYWAFLGIPPDEFVSLMLCVDPTNETNGAIEVYPGLHRSALPDAPDEPRDLDPRGVDGRTPRLVSTAAGDVLLLHPMAPHRSGTNRSSGSRRILTAVYTLAKNTDASRRYYAAR